MNQIKKSMKTCYRLVFGFFLKQFEFVLTLRVNYVLFVAAASIDGSHFVVLSESVTSQQEA